MFPHAAKVPRRRSRRFEAFELVKWSRRRRIASSSLRRAGATQTLSESWYAGTRNVSFV
jgi:hypothetical protein